MPKEYDLNIKEPAREPYNFKSKLVMHTTEEEKEIESKVRQAQIKYSKHEFIKTNQVGLLISEAL